MIYVIGDCTVDREVLQWRFWCILEENGHSEVWPVGWNCGL